MKITGYQHPIKEVVSAASAPAQVQPVSTIPSSAIVAEDIFFGKLEKSLPPVFTREEAAKHMGGILAAKTLNNIDYRGEGPEVRVRIGKKIGYERETFVQWLRQYRKFAE